MIKWIHKAKGDEDMTMELFKVGANGQMEIDFESLEALTSAKFVSFVQERIQSRVSTVTSVHFEQEEGISALYIRGIGATEIFDDFKGVRFEHKTVYDADVTAILKMDRRHWGYLYRE